MKKITIITALFLGYSVYLQAIAGEVILGTVTNNTNKPIEIRAAQELPLLLPVQEQI